MGAGSFDPQGPVAEAMANLWWLMLVLGTAVFVVFGVLLVVGLRKRPPVEDQTDRQTRGRFGRWFVVWGVALPSVVILVVLVATIVAMREVPSDAPPDALPIEIVGHRWWWEVRYPDAGVTTANEVHIPVGRPVAFQLTSADVIHSFWVPELAGKMDLLPDDVNTLVLQADEPGEHRSHCAEFCGLQHTNMGLTVVAESEDRFARWVAARQQAASEPTDPAAQRGQEIFLRSDCMSCHTIQGSPATGEVGPDLTHVASRPTLGAGVVPNTPEDLASWITDPHAVKEGVSMPATTFDDAELQDLLAYLETLR